MPIPGPFSDCRSQASRSRCLLSSALEFRPSFLSGTLECRLCFPKRTFRRFFGLRQRPSFSALCHGQSSITLIRSVSLAHLRMAPPASRERFHGGLGVRGVAVDRGAALGLLVAGINQPHVHSRLQYMRTLVAASCAADCEMPVAPPNAKIDMTTAAKRRNSRRVLMCGWPPPGKR